MVASVVEAYVCHLQTSLASKKFADRKRYGLDVAVRIESGQQLL
jgi:hypothetical protein